MDNDRYLELITRLIHLDDDIYESELNIKKCIRRKETYQQIIKTTNGMDSVNNFFCEMMIAYEITQENNERELLQQLKGVRKELEKYIYNENK